MTAPSELTPSVPPDYEQLRNRLNEVEATLRAIRSGAVDALVEGERIYSLRGAETPYRLLIEAMGEGAGTVTREGIVLMSLAEALLRIPDADIANRLIQDKMGSAEWDKQIGQSDSLFVNASTCACSPALLASACESSAWAAISASDIPALPAATADSAS